MGISGFMNPHPENQNHIPPFNTCLQKIVGSELHAWCGKWNYIDYLQKPNICKAQQKERFFGKPNHHPILLRHYINVCII